MTRTLKNGKLLYNRSALDYCYSITINLKQESQSSCHKEPGPTQVLHVLSNLTWSRFNKNRREVSFVWLVEMFFSPHVCKRDNFPIPNHICNIFFVCFILLTHEGSHRKVYQEFQPCYDIFCRWCQGLFRLQVPCIPSLNCPIANSGWTKSQQPV